MDKKTATVFIKRRATEDTPQENQARLIEVVETELMSLHEGNIARYRLRPMEYQCWRQNWDQVHGRLEAKVKSSNSSAATARPTSRG